ncbi:hypothetical protein L7F22_002121 [Adiantum nelumboides]|nr:hypothetical protein [Adiantum nelumboides]
MQQPYSYAMHGIATREPIGLHWMRQVKPCSIFTTALVSSRVPGKLWVACGGQELHGRMPLKAAFTVASNGGIVHHRWRSNGHGWPTSAKAQRWPRAMLVQELLLHAQLGMHGMHARAVKGGQGAVVHDP